jgi:hypothetical protein
VNSSRRPARYAGSDARRAQGELRVPRRRGVIPRAGRRGLGRIAPGPRRKSGSNSKRRHRGAPRRCCWRIDSRSGSRTMEGDRRTTTPAPRRCAEPHWNPTVPSVDLPHQVNIHDPLELPGCRQLECCEEAHRGEVHSGVEPPVLLDGTVGHRLYLVELRSVGDRHGSLATLAPYLLYQGV